MEMSRVLGRRSGNSAIEGYRDVDVKASSDAAKPFHVEHADEMVDGIKKWR